MISSGVMSLFLLLGSLTQSHYPDDPYPIEPYMGVDFQPFPKKTVVTTSAPGATTTTRETIRQRKVFFTLGLPLRLKKVELQNSLTKFNLFATPEIHLTTDFTILNFLLMPQMIFPFGSRYSNPSSLVVEIGGGFSYGILQAKSDKVDGTGKVLSDDQRTLTAGVVAVSMGPQFDVSNFFAVRVRGNVEFYVGEIPLYTIRTEWNQHTGMTLGLQGQVIF